MGGHVAAIPGVETMIDADHMVPAKATPGCAVTWEKTRTRPSAIPPLCPVSKRRIMGMLLPERKGGTAATIIPSVGCPMGCNFCTTSAFFGGKGKF